MNTEINHEFPGIDANRIPFVSDCRVETGEA